MNVKLRYSTRFIAGVYYNNIMSMNTYSVTLSMITNSNDGESHNIAFDRIKFFLSDILDSSIFINLDNQDQCMKLLDAGLEVTTLPEEPVDQVIGLMLYCKLNAIAEGRLIIEEIEISSDLGDNVIYTHNEEESVGPFVLPGWWLKPTVTHNDLDEFADSNNVVTVNSMLWKELDLNWPEESESGKLDSANTIVFADFHKNETE